MTLTSKLSDSHGLLHRQTTGTARKWSGLDKRLHSVTESVDQLHREDGPIEPTRSHTALQRRHPLSDQARHCRHCCRTTSGSDPP